jgi:hypothetical protein
MSTSDELEIEYDEQGRMHLPMPEGTAERIGATEETEALVVTGDLAEAMGVIPRSQPDRLNVWDRITFHPNLTVRQLRDIAAVYGVHIRPKASRDEVALIMRRHGITAGA